MSSMPTESRQWTLDEATDSVLERQRQQATEGGARYRQTARDRSQKTPSVDQECKECGGHVGRQYVRVFGVDGQIEACPDCADTTELLNGAAAGRHRRETL